MRPLMQQKQRLSQLQNSLQNWQQALRTSSVQNFYPQFRLRTLLVLPMVLQVFGMMSLVGYLSYRNGQKAIQDLSGQLRTSVMNRVEEQVRSYLEKPMLVNEINLGLARQGILKVNDRQSLESYFLIQSKQFNQLGTLAYSSVKDSGYVGANGSEEYTIVATPKAGLLRYAFGKKPGQRGDLLVTQSNYDVRNRPWYQAALTSKQARWSSVYASPIGQRLDISAVQPFYQQERKGEVLQGIFASQISLSGIGQFLQQLEISRSGQVFILERNGLLIANSAMEDPFIPGRNGTSPTRLPALNSNNPVIQSTVKTLIDRFQGLAHIQGTQKIDFRFNGEQQFLQVQPFQDRYGIDWLIVVVVPESAFMGQIHKNTYMTIVLCLIAMGVAIVLGIITSYGMSRKLYGIAQASEAISQGDLSRSLDSSLITEIASLSHSFNSMSAQLKESFATLEDRVETRTFELKNERDRSEQLLLNILPSSIADQLKQNNAAPAEHFTEATILFADIVGFTSLSARLEPMELVAGLNQIFSAFDALTEKYGLEKIKTIGDAYMVAGGIPIARPDHAQAIAAMALEMRQEMHRLNAVLGEPLEIRIGIHSGPVVAGVIGIRKFIYDLWGDAVNIASRMESHGQPGCIHVTDATYALLKDDYCLEPRGTIVVKGRGEMQTYWLSDRRSKGLTESVVAESVVAESVVTESLR